MSSWFVLLLYGLGVCGLFGVYVCVCCVMSCVWGMLGGCLVHVFCMFGVCVFVVCLVVFGACVWHVSGIGLFWVLFGVCFVYGWCVFAVYFFVCWMWVSGLCVSMFVCVIVCLLCVV